jgi:transcription antitermination factor NusB
MRKRTLAREYALQILYQVDITKDNTSEYLENFWTGKLDAPPAESVKDFTAQLVQGVMQNLGEIDKKLALFAENWELERMAVIDRNILRLAVYEIIYRQDIPPKVSINEAIELSKKYSTQEAAKFVNGVLDKIKQEANK